MKTGFTPAQLADPAIAVADKILRACVHCGFCTATCPTYVLLGDELDSPRGRIYLIKDMLENDRAPTAEVVKHIDRCLTCLACMTTCPSGVDYMHLLDVGRARIEATYRRPPLERAMRDGLARVLTRPERLRALLTLGNLGAPLAAKALGLLRGVTRADWVNKVLAALALRPAMAGSAAPAPGSVFPPIGTKRGRVAILQGCAQQVIAPDINDATIRVLTRHGYEVVLVRGEQCCGGLSHHLGREHEARAFMRANIECWSAEAAGEGLDAILITASGCGTTIKDYGFLFRDDPRYAERARQVSALALDITEFLARIELAVRKPPQGIVVAYHAACSLQHGQKITRQPKDLLSNCGFVVKDIPEGHLCCGSAGTYNILQSDIAGRLRDRKLANIESVGADVIAAGNIGCITHIGAAAKLPVVHTIALIDWATGGPQPMALQTTSLQNQAWQDPPRSPASRLTGHDAPRSA